MSDAKSLNHNPLAETDAILSEDFYGGGKRGPARKPSGRPKPTHYKVICISMYTKDLQELDAKVAELKRRGYTKANKSQLIRLALSKLDIDSVPVPS